MKRFIAAAFTAVTLVFATGCVGTADSESADDEVAVEAPKVEEQACPKQTKMPICGAGEGVVCGFLLGCPRCYCAPF